MNLTQEGAPGGSVTRIPTKKYENPFRVIDSGMLNVFSTRKNYLQSKVVSLPINILKKENGIHRLTFIGEWENCQQMIKEEPIDQVIFNNFSIETSAIFFL